MPSKHLQWTNGAGDNSWHTSGNWAFLSGGGGSYLPTGADVLYFGNGYSNADCSYSGGGAGICNSILSSGYTGCLKLDAPSTNLSIVDLLEVCENMKVVIRTSGTLLEADRWHDYGGNYVSGGGGSVAVSTVLAAVSDARFRGNAPSEIKSDLPIYEGTTYTLEKTVDSNALHVWSGVNFKVQGTLNYHRGFLKGAPLNMAGGRVEFDCVFADPIVPNSYYQTIGSPIVCDISDEFFSGSVVHIKDKCRRLSWVYSPIDYLSGGGGWGDTPNIYIRHGTLQIDKKPDLYLQPTISGNWFGNREYGIVIDGGRIECRMTAADMNHLEGPTISTVHTNNSGVGILVQGLSGNPGVMELYQDATSAKYTKLYVNNTVAFGIDSELRVNGKGGSTNSGRRNLIDCQELLLDYEVTSDLFFTHQGTPTSGDYHRIVDASRMTGFNDGIVDDFQSKPNNSDYTTEITDVGGYTRHYNVKKP